MSMLDGFFNKGFKAAKCKTLLKLTIPRIKLLRNRREIQLKQMRKDIAKLLENGQEATARIRVEHIIREENMMAAQEIIELFCELIAVRLPIIETQRECPLDLKEAISSICFAAPRCADLPELQQVQMLFATKYGKEFVTAATELMPNCGVNRQIIELLSVRAPPVETKMKLLKEIAEEHEVDWDPSATETEFLKPHEDLLNGPNYLPNGSTLPIPEEKHDEALSSGNVEGSHEEPDADEGFDSLDLPEVPKVSVRPALDIPSAHDSVSDLPTALRHDLTLDHEVENPTSSDEGMPRIPTVEPKMENPKPSLASHFIEPDALFAAWENKQFIPFISPPSLSSPSLPVTQSEPAPSPPSFSSVLVPHKEASFSSPSLFTNQSKPAASPTSFSPPSPSTNPSKPVVSLSRTKSEANVDLQDVLAAAHAAAETAERAAAAARAAANLAQVRISDLVSKRNNYIPESFENEIQGKDSHQSEMAEKPVFHSHDSLDQNDSGTSYELNWGSGSPALSSHEAPNREVKSPDLKNQMPEDRPAHEPQRLSSLEEDPYFSYPNLFSRQDSNLKSGVQTSANSRSPDEF